MMVLLLYSTRYGGEKGKSKLHACTLKYFAEPFLLPITIAICEVSLLKVPDSSSQHRLRTFRTIVPFFIHATRGPLHCRAANSVFFTASTLTSSNSLRLPVSSASIAIGSLLSELTMALVYFPTEL